MNAFYERLQLFGASVQAAAEKTKQPLARQFRVVHPSYPVVSRTRSTVPQLEFMEECPVSERRRIRKLLRQAFRRRKED